MYGQRHQVFDAATEKKHESTFVWAERSAKVLVMVGVFGIAASSFAASPDSIDVNAFDKTKPAIAQAKGFNKKIKDRAPKYHKAHPNKKSQDKDDSVDKARIIHDIKERKKAIQAAIAISPDKVADAALPKDVYDALPEEVKSDVEFKTDVYGNWKAGHYHTLKKGVKGDNTQTADVVQLNGSRVRLSGTQLPEVGANRQVKVTGYELDNHLAVAAYDDVKVKPLKEKSSSKGAAVMELAGARSKGIGLPVATTKSHISLADSSADAKIIASYYDNIDLAGPSVYSTTPKIDFNWQAQGPSGIGPDTFSAQFAAKLAIPTDGKYTLSTVSDDGVRVWLNGQLIIDNWRDHPPTLDVAQPITWTANSSPALNVEYFENTGNATLQLRWSGPGIPDQVIPQTAFESWSSAGDQSANIYALCYSTCSLTDSGSYETVGSYGATDNNGSNKILIVPIKLDGSEVPKNTATNDDYTPEDFRSLVNSKITKYSLSNFYRAGSYGALNLEADVLPWQQLDIRAGCDNHDDSSVMNAIDYRMSGNPDVSTGKYQNVMYVLADINCTKSTFGFTSSAWGEIGPGSVEEPAHSMFYLDGFVEENGSFDNLLEDQIDPEVLVSAMEHETGHNFGLSHAHGGCATGVPACDKSDVGLVEYGNPYDTMGQDSYLNTGQFSLHSKLYIGWIANSSIQTVTKPGLYAVDALELPSMQHRGLRIPVQGTNIPGQTLYVEYRPAGTGDSVDTFETDGPSPAVKPGLIINEVGPASEFDDSNPQKLLNSVHDGAWDYTKAALAENETYRYHLDPKATGDQSTDVCIKFMYSQGFTATVAVYPGCNQAEIAPFTSIGPYDKDKNYIGATHRSTQVATPTTPVPAGYDETNEPSFLQSASDSCRIRNNLYVYDAGRVLRYDISTDQSTDWSGGPSSAYAPSKLRAINSLGAIDPNKIVSASTDMKTRAMDTTWRRVSQEKLGTPLADNAMGMFSNGGGKIACDAEGNRVFVSDYYPSAYYGDGTNPPTGGKIIAFDVSKIANEQKSAFVLGQNQAIYPAPNAATRTEQVYRQMFLRPGAALSASSLSNTRPVYSPAQKYLYVSDYAANRVVVYDLSNGGTTGMAAKYVIGQPNFTSSGANNITGVGNFFSIVVDDEQHRLFVTAARSTSSSTPVYIEVFDTTKLANGMKPLYEIKTDIAVSSAKYLSYDFYRRRLFLDGGTKLYAYDAMPGKLSASSAPLQTLALKNIDSSTGTFSNYDSTSQVLSKNVINNFAGGSSIIRVLFYRVPEPVEWKNVTSGR